MSIDLTYDAPERLLRGPEKVAALLLVMGKTVASKLLGHFDPPALKLITRAAANLGSVPTDLIEELVEEFAQEFSKGSQLLGTVEHAENLLTGALPPDQVADIISELRGSSNRGIWDKIAALSPQTLVDHLSKQHPQVITLVLANLGPSSAAAVMELLPRHLRNEATRRLLVLGPVADAAVRVIETHIHHDLILNPPPAAGAATSRIANIINKMAPEHVDDVLRSLEEAQPEEAQALRSKLFTFEDLLTLPQASRQALFEKVPSDRVVTALAGTDADFRANVLSSLTARARRLVENELSSAGTSSAKDVTAARRLITDTLLDMSQRGEVELRTEDA